MPTITKIQKHHLAQILGLDDIDNEAGDETAISSVNVRFDQMFREVIGRNNSLIIVAEQGLRAIADNILCWMSLVKVIRSSSLQFDPKEGISDEIVRYVNDWPERIYERIASPGYFFLVSTPMLEYKKSRGKVKLSAYSLAAKLPTELPDK
jgi:hypothetical protein